MRQAKIMRLLFIAIILKEEEGGLLPKKPLQYRYLKQFFLQYFYPLDQLNLTVIPYNFICSFTLENSLKWIPVQQRSHFLFLNTISNCFIRKWFCLQNENCLLFVSILCKLLVITFKVQIGGKVSASCDWFVLFLPLYPYIFLQMLDICQQIRCCQKHIPFLKNNSEGFLLILSNLK